MSGTASSIWAGGRHVADVSASLAGTRGAIRRNAWLIVAWILVCDGIGLAYVKIVRPEFVATTQVLLRPRHIANDGPEDVRHVHQFELDSAQSETELRVLRSERLLSRVFNALGLADSPEMRGGADGFWAALARQLHRWAPGIVPFTEELRAFYTFSDRARSRRLGLSYVIDVSYRAHNAEQAARVANAVASAYLGDRLRSALAGAQSSGAYTKARVTSLLGQTLAADVAMRAGTVPDRDLPDSDVRVLGPATVPLRPVYPKAVPILILATGIGLVSGLLLILFQNRSTNVLRTQRRSSREICAPLIPV